MFTASQEVQNMAYKIYCFKKEGENMQSIGDALKAKREEIKIGVAEVATDLGATEKQVEMIEAGDRHAFDDVFDLKEFIRTYAKYLGLDSKKMIDEFNEYLFDFTSKIPLKAIEIAKQEKELKPEEVKSPYTLPVIKWKPYLLMGGIFLVIILGLLITYLVVYYKNSDALTSCTR